MMETAKLSSPDALRKWVFGACEAGSHCVALIDPSRYPDVDACRHVLEFDAESFAALPNLYGKFAASVREKGPRLFMAPIDAPTWGRIFEESFHRQVASFLIVPEGASDLQEHLLHRVRMRQPAGHNVLFRFQDVVVLSTLSPLLRASQKQALLGPASHWLMADLCSNPVVIESPRAVLSKQQVLQLDRQQLEALDLALRPLTIIFQTNETDSTLLADLDKCAQINLIRERMQRARTHGLHREEDVALYCVLSLQLPAGFDSAGPVAEALERSRIHGTGFGEEIDLVPVERWRELDEVLDASKSE